MDNRLRQLKNILYNLKRAYGLQVTFVKPTQTVNRQTGVVTRTYTTKVIKRVIMLPSRTARDFAYDLSYIAANKNFTYGGHYDTAERRMIIDRKDMPASFGFGMDCSAEFDDLKWDIKSITAAENNAGWLVIVKAQPNADTVS